MRLTFVRFFFAMNCYYKETGVLVLVLVERSWHRASVHHSNGCDSVFEVGIIAAPPCLFLSTHLLLDLRAFFPSKGFGIEDFS